MSSSCSTSKDWWPDHCFQAYFLPREAVIKVGHQIFKEVEPFRWSVLGRPKETLIRRRPAHQTSGRGKTSKKTKHENLRWVFPCWFSLSFPRYLSNQMVLMVFFFYHLVRRSVACSSGRWISFPLLSSFSAFFFAKEKEKERRKQRKTIHLAPAHEPAANLFYFYNENHSSWHVLDDRYFLF